MFESYTWYRIVAWAHIYIYIYTYIYSYIYSYMGIHSDIWHSYGYVSLWDVWVCDGRPCMWSSRWQYWLLPSIIFMCQPDISMEWKRSNDNQTHPNDMIDVWLRRATWCMKTGKNTAWAQLGESRRVCTGIEQWLHVHLYFFTCFFSDRT